MMHFNSLFRDGIPTKEWSYWNLVDAEASWVVSGLFINASDPIKLSWV